MTDTELLLQLYRDPDAGFAALIDRYAGLLLSVVRGVLDGWSPSEIEECVSDVFTDFYINRDRVDLSRGSIKGYLCAAARHDALDLLRKSGRRRTEALDEDLSDGGASVEEQLIECEQREDLLRALETLENPDREIIVRKYYLHQSGKTIAAAMGMSEGNVNVRTHRALQKLREALTGGGD